MSEPFRDLERASRSPEALLCAAISSLEAINRPDRLDLARFETLFMPLYETVAPDARRTASAALSRLPVVPAAVADLIINEPISIAAPFIAHYRGLDEALLAQAISRHGAGHARAAARRRNLSAEAIAALGALGDPSVDRILALKAAPADTAATLRPAVSDAPSVDGPRLPVEASPSLAPDLTELPSPTQAAPETADAVREDLRRLALTGRPASRPAPSRSAASPERSRPFSRRMRVPQARLQRLEQMIGAAESDWFLTALADALESSVSLAARILSDLSGHQLATTLVALNLPKEPALRALTHYFPALALPAGPRTKAEELLMTLEREPCMARVEAWQRADSYAAASQVMVPALAPDLSPAGRLRGSSSTLRDKRGGLNTQSTSETTRKTG